MHAYKHTYMYSTLLFGIRIFVEIHRCFQNLVYLHFLNILHVYNRQ